MVKTNRPSHPSESEGDRLELIRDAVNETLSQQPDEETRRWGFVHLYGVSATCVLLAAKRGLDPQLCAVAEMLHDIWTYKTGDPTDHARQKPRGSWRRPPASARMRLVLSGTL